MFDKKKILISPIPHCEVYAVTTQQHQTALNRHFQEFHKSRLNETKNLMCSVEYVGIVVLKWKSRKAEIFSLAVPLFAITVRPGTSSIYLPEVVLSRGSPLSVHLFP